MQKHIYLIIKKKKVLKNIAIVGSSNLTLSGLINNTELNVVVHVNENHK